MLGRPDVPVDRQAQEIWLGALGDRGSGLAEDFGQPALAAACRILTRGINATDALRAYDEITRREASVGLAIELGRRALARCAAHQGNAGEFSAELFAGATAYYASRDLSSFVAAPGRIETTSNLIRLKQDLQETTRERVRAIGAPPTDSRGWARYVKAVLTRLRD